MAQSGWDDQFKSFMKRAGDDLKRMGEDIRGEAQRLIVQVKDPEKKEQVRAKAREVGAWAKQTAAEVADMVRNITSREEGEKASAPKPAAKAAKAGGAKKKKAPARKKPAGATPKTIGRKKKA